MLEEFVRFVFGRFPVVARGSDVQIAWQRIAPQGFDLMQNIFRNERGVCALALG